MQKNLTVTSSPHLRSSRSTKSIMQEVCLALAPAGIAGVVLFGWQALAIILTSVLSCVLSEYFFQRLNHKKILIGDWSAVVTGLLLAYNIPANAPLWIPLIGGIIAIVLVKQLFGGLGGNFMNPALTARAILFVSWSGIMSNYPATRFMTDATTSGTPLVQIAAGENVAIVGHSGCGKSTLVRLLLGFEKPRSGAIYYDGQSLAELSLPSVRSQMGVVLQNGQLMAGDIFTNIVGQAALTQDDAWAAAEAAGIADDIRAMPMGMNTVISEGSENISGGQRQRIMIARALAAKPAILIFDEATSALDNHTQSIVTESLNKLKTTRLVIAHRLSTIKECDRILVMDKGTLVESGTYDELLAKNGIFAQLVRRQVA